MFKCHRLEEKSLIIDLQKSESPTLESKKPDLVVKVADVEDEAVLNSIRNEAQILPKLNCALINKFEAYYEDLERNKVYLILENAGEQTLTSYMELEQNQLLDLPPKTLSATEVKQIMTKLFQATEYLHRNGICHRDLKPDNIMLTKSASN